jgi:hypothetical protein
MGYTKVVKRQDIDNFIENLEYTYKKEKEKLPIDTRQFIEEFVFGFDKYINEECPQVFVRDLENMPEKKALFPKR